MSLWQRLRDSLRGPTRIAGMDDPEVEADFAEEMPAAAEDAEVAARSESMISRGGVAVPPDPTLPPGTSIAFEGEQEAANEKAAEEPDQGS